MLSFFCVSINAEFQKSERPDFRPASLDDEVYTPSPRRSEGRRDQLGGAVRAAPRAKPLCQP